EALRPIVVGYEISTRIGAAMGRAHYKHWHNTGTIGCFGAAAAAAEALLLNRDQFAHALATVTTFAAGLQQAFRMDSMSKPLHAGRAAEAGVAAALMAREGVTGSLDVMQGFAAAMGDKPDWEKGLATMGKDFHITRMTFKNHACCGHTFAAIDGALEVQRRMQAKPEDIDAVEVATYKAGLEVAHYENPRTPAEGRFSLKYVVATALSHGSVRLAAFEQDRLSDATTRRLMDRISLKVDPELEAAFPAQRAARVAIRARGKREEWLQPTRIGDPEAPLSDRALEEKYFELVAPVLGEARAREVLARLWKLE
ncbi:MAG: MmgE/PrpD family protein, partial [Burkholderiales bacterium]